MSSTDTSVSETLENSVFAAALLSEIEQWGVCLMQATIDQSGVLHISVLTRTTVTDSGKFATDTEQGEQLTTESDSSPVSDWSVSLLLNLITDPGSGPAKN